MRRQCKWMAGICLGMLALNLLAWCSMSFSTWYVRNVFPLFSGIWSRLTGVFPFSVGEFLIEGGILLLLAGSMLLGICLFFPIRKKAAAIAGILSGWILTWLFSVLTLHFLILYHAQPFLMQYYPDAQESFTDTEILDVLEQLVEEINTVSAEVQRDAEGHFLLTEELHTCADTAMQKLGTQYPQYSGSYPHAKPISHAYFFSQQNLLGIYFPFTMEANYNPAACPVNLPVTVCHELVHLKGNIFEDEAGFLAFLACQESGIPEFQYSGDIAALEHMLNIPFPEENTRRNEILSRLNPEVWNDLYTFVPEDYWSAHAEEAILPEEVLSSELISQASDLVVDTNLKANGISEGIRSYSGIVRLLLVYYGSAD